MADAAHADKSSALRDISPGQSHTSAHITRASRLDIWSRMRLQRSNSGNDVGSFDAGFQMCTFPKHNQQCTESTRIRVHTYESDPILARCCAQNDLVPTGAEQAPSRQFLAGAGQISSRRSRQSHTCGVRPGTTTIVHTYGQVMASIQARYKISKEIHNTHTCECTQTSRAAAHDCDTIGIVKYTFAF